ncbi:hypothetical protein RND81_03G033900 [Saponaria officinalis]|uniref:DUF7950 domain-containing protein n=1 Tax=Saponaria officinalis TaxID=3572 RepID=A0AAW1M2A0_SAPOF
MIQALSMPYSSSKRDEIMSRYRPIAPKPEAPNGGGGSGSGDSGNEGGLVPEKFRQSPYLRNIWSHLQARPTRTRKRGRTAGISPAALFRKQQEREPGYMGFCSSVNLPSHARNISFHAFGMHGGDYQHAHHNEENNRNNNNNNNLIELPLLSCPLLTEEPKVKEIDLNKVDDFEERDLSLQLKVPSNNNNNNHTPSVISPRPVRPVGSTISIVGPIGEDLEAVPILKTAETVEAEVETEALPAVISDRANKVRVVNSAYKELVGQPECPWLDSMVSGRRISGEVMINYNSGFGVPVAARKGFNCWVRIEWESEGKKKNVNAFCEVMRMACESKDYVFYWRFHTREVSPSASKV